MGAYVYMLRCADNTIYTGWTDSLEKRLALHNAGKASKYTRARLPVEMIWWEEQKNRVDAQKREWEIKKLSRRRKQELCNMKGPKI